MKCVHRHSSKGQWPEKEAATTITLDFDARHRRRMKLVTDAGEEVLLDLPKAVAMADGDGLQLEDGRWLIVRAAPEPVVEVRHEGRGQLARLAWHLGNRHLPVEIKENSLVIRPDHVVEEMLIRFGAKLTVRDAAFQPEGGAYAAARHGHADDASFGDGQGSDRGHHHEH